MIAYSMHRQSLRLQKAKVRKASKLYSYSRTSVNQKTTWEKRASFNSCLLPWHKLHPQRQYVSAYVTLFRCTYPFSYMHISPGDMKVYVHWSRVTCRYIFHTTEAVSFCLCYRQPFHFNCSTNVLLVWSGLCV